MAQPAATTTLQVLITFVVTILLSTQNTVSWLLDSQSKLYIKHGDIRSHVFYGNQSHVDHFKLLDQDYDYLLLGARNIVYNVSLSDLKENKAQRIEWISSAAHQELCYLKGKEEDECQNYVRILVRTDSSNLLICGTNSYKPKCREYKQINEKYENIKEFEGRTQCPYNPEHNSTAVYHNGQLYTATVSDFSGGDSLIYRQPQRTERSDLKQLNAPNFVSSFAYGDYVFFFYRETAVEFINCGKAKYSRVARVCKDDKGGPHQFGDRWTSFLKARLNCSVPGEYPFYFDEIQATSDVINGYYRGKNEDMVYGVMTTPVNSIGGSAICAYSMREILKAFEGSFKDQDGINANWLPIPNDRVPDPRPGKCVKDSRTLPDIVVNFVKSHPLMEEAVPSHFEKPLLIRVSLQYRFTTIAVDPQVRSVDSKPYDILYIGTDDGRVLKAVSLFSEGKSSSVVITESQVLPTGTSITELRAVSSRNKLVVVSRSQVRTVPLYYCNNITKCRDCVELQDPHCAWDTKTMSCVSLNSHPDPQPIRFIQSVLRGDSSKCSNPGWRDEQESKVLSQGTVSSIGEIDNKIIEDVTTNILSGEGNKLSNSAAVIPVQERLVIYTAETLHIVLIVAIIAALAVGFVIGYFFSRRFHPIAPFAETPFIEQHNHLNRFGNANANTSGFLPPRANKAINLNVPANKMPIKKDNNLEQSKEFNNSIESIDKDTLQKVKKTYI